MEEYPVLMKLETLEEVLLTIFKTIDIEESVPVSVLLIAPQGQAKTSLISQHQGPAILMTDSFTQSGLWDIVASDPKNEIGFLLTSDLNPTLSRAKHVVESAIGNLLSLTFDGTIRIDDGRQNKLLRHEPIGFIAGATPETFQRYARKWFALGLRRRIIPLYYEYSLSTIEKIQEQVRTDKITRKIAINPIIHTRLQAKVKPIIPENESHEIKSLSSKFALNLGKLATLKREKDKRTYEWVVKNVAPIDPHLTLRTLARAHALVKRKPKVNSNDLEFLISFIEFTDPERPRQL